MKTKIINVAQSEVEEVTFNNYRELNEKLISVSDTTEWREVSSKTTQFQDTNSNPFPEMGGSEFDGIEVSFNSGFTFLPIRYTAMNSILARAEVNGSGLKNLFVANKKLFAEHINDYLEVKSEGRTKMLALIQDGKVSAIHSGNYTPISMVDIFKAVECYLEDFTDDYVFVSGNWSWKGTEAIYRVYDKDITSVYNKMLKKYFKNEAVSLSLRAISSDVAQAAVRFYPYLELDTAIPLAGTSSVKHIGDVDINTVEEKLERTFEAFEASCRSLAALADIKLSNRKNVLIKAFTFLKIPQKHASSIVERYENTPTNALEIYYDVCEVLPLLRQSVSSDVALQYEEMITRLVTINRRKWLSFDVSGIVSWNAKNN